MFFRRAVIKTLTFDDHLSAARSAGFGTDSAGGGKSRIERNGIACLAQEEKAACRSSCSAPGW